MSVKTQKVTVAIASDFLTAFAKIPRQQQGKVLEFINKFRANPAHPGINYEKIKQAKDPNVRSVRIDQSYRGIALKPDSGNVYVLLWVDHHDKAYKWAANKVCNIHPDTGSLQVIALEEETQATPDKPAPKPGLFDSLRDRNLTRLGVPESLLPLVRSIKTGGDLDKMLPHFPQEAAEALYWLSEGDSFEDVCRAMERPEEPEPVDVGDFAAALDNPDSQRRFFVVDNEQELEAMLHAPLEKWRVFLHPSQRKLAENAWNGPTRVLGGAGTGKTVVAMHRAKWLATKVFTGENDRILFTTFTRNLAADIKDNLRKICPDNAMRRIEVINLDRWVSEFLGRNGYDQKVVFGHRTKELWEKALTAAPANAGLDSSFYREEWDRVIQPQSVETLEEYMKATRVGRGVRLNRKARQDVWPVFEEYRVLLNDAGLREGIDAMRDARRLLEKKGNVLPYKAVIVDEAQDMGMQAFMLIRSLVPKEEEKPCVFIVGDAHQRIYRHKVVLSRCGLDIRGRARKLRINYRTTDETRGWAVSLLQGAEVDDLDGGSDDQKGYRSLMHGVEPRIEHFDTFESESKFIAAFLTERGKTDGALTSTCLVTRTNELLEQYESSLNANGIETYRVRRTEAEDRRASGVRLATMHRVKGIEFDTVVIAGVNEGVVPLSFVAAESADPVVKSESDVHERALLYVAATRAKKDVLVTSFGKASCFLG